jgi:hypothetical protein
MRLTHRATRKTSLLDDARYGVPEEGVAAFVEAPAKTDRYQDKWSNKWSKLSGAQLGEEQLLH